MFAGRRTARWALQFVPFVFAHPESMTRADVRGGDYWEEWFGWSQLTARVVEQTNYFLMANGAKMDQLLKGPRSGSVQPMTLDDAFARIST